MTEQNKNFAEYGHFKRNIDPKIIEKIRCMDLDTEPMPLKDFIEICELLKIKID